MGSSVSASKIALLTGWQFRLCLRPDPSDGLRIRFHELPDQGQSEHCEKHIRSDLPHCKSGCVNTSFRCRNDLVPRLQDAHLFGSTNAVEWYYTVRQEHHFPQDYCMVHRLLFLGSHHLTLEQLRPDLSKEQFGYWWMASRQLRQWSRMVWIHHVDCAYGYGGHIGGEDTSS